MRVEPRLSIATWKYNKEWVYSISYDEALADLARFVIPAHEDLGIPGHVEVVASQIGQVRACGSSSYNGMRHMNADELKALVAMGWGVGNHSWSHGKVMDDPETELLRSKQAIEAAIGRPVTVYTSCGDNQNLTPDVQAKLREYGYLAGMSITDDINRPDAEDLLWVNRVPIHERYWGVFDSAFDPYKRIRQAQVEHGWIVDYLHCPLEQPVHPYKDCSAAHHRERLEAVVEAGEGSCWFANPDDVVDYRCMRRHTQIEPDAEAPGRFVVKLESLPEQVRCRDLTFKLKSPWTPEATSILANGSRIRALTTRAGVLSFTINVPDGGVSLSF